MDNKKRIYEIMNVLKRLIKPTGLRDNGYTLIEIIIVILIISIISGITIKFLIDSIKIYSMSVNQNRIYEEAKLAIERICRDIRDAKTITSPSEGSSGSEITFQRTHQTLKDSQDEIITFRLNGNILEKIKTSPSTACILASNVSSFIVSRGSAGNNEITLQLTLSLNTGENITLQTKVYPKNLPVSSGYKNYFGNWQEEISS